MSFGIDEALVADVFSRSGNHKVWVVTLPVGPKGCIKDYSSLRWYCGFSPPVGFKRKSTADSISLGTHYLSGSERCYAVVRRTKHAISTIDGVLLKAKEIRL